MKKLNNVAGYTAVLLGLVLAVATSAFKPAKKLNRLSFEYAGPDYSIANIEDEGNWQHVEGTASCDNEDQVACRIQVDESFVNNPSSANPTLQSAINIQAAEFSSNVAYVLDTDDESATISNALQ